VNLASTHDARKRLLTHVHEYLGKILTVKFFEYTDDGLPRFGIGKAVRDYE
jgi:hypothetical protein